MHNILNRFILCCTCFALLSACSAPQQLTVKQRYFWPPLPDRPRIEWIGTYQNDLDLRIGPASVLANIIGEDVNVQLDSPFHLTSNGEGKVYIGDLGLRGYVVFDFNTAKAQFLDVPMTKPAGAAIDAKGLFYGGDAASRKVYVFDKNNKNIGVLDLSKQLKSFGSFAIDKQRQRLIVPDGGGCRIAVYELNGTHLFSFGGPGNADGYFNNPVAVALDSVGNIIVADSFNARVQRFTPEGKFISKFGERHDQIGGFSIIKGIAVDSGDNIYVTDGKMNWISIFNANGDVLMSLGSTYALSEGRKAGIGGFFIPQGIAIDKNDRIYVADMMNHRIQIFQYLTTRYLEKNPIKNNGEQ